MGVCIRNCTDTDFCDKLLMPRINTSFQTGDKYSECCGRHLKLIEQKAIPALNASIWLWRHHLSVSDRFLLTGRKSDLLAGES